MKSGYQSVRPSVCPSVRLSVRPDYIFFEWEGKTGRRVIKGCGGFKTNLNKKVGGVIANNFVFSITYVRIIFFFKWEGKAGKGDDSGQLKKNR